ncbi:MAG TPA: fumarylacetoacetate hydrolase family protein [Blastocatellia bacterium]|nr:fumarylacetoacetate hydrolase family protein [Blastocatellia bacterium]
MKLVSMKLEGVNRAGVVVGAEVANVTGLLAMSNQGRAGARTFEDALDVLRGPSLVEASMNRLARDHGFAAQCREARVLISLSEVKLNPPVLEPGKILAVGLNYAAHAAEQGGQPPEFPLIFTKCVTALLPPEEAIRLPRVSDEIDYEGELAVVIGREAKSVRAAEAFDYVAGYTIMNDVTARDLQRRERQWTRAKGLDTFAPCGPWLVTKDEIPDPHALDLELRVNGELRQKSNTSDLIFKVPELIEFISQDLTLLPGDIVSTGTPSGVGVYRDPPVFLRPGDEIEIEIGRIGKLRNPVGVG